MNIHDDDDGRFELYRADDREWFRLIWRDRMLLRSHGEATREQTLADVDRLCGPSSILRACMTASGHFYFTAQTIVGEVLATSSMFELPAERDEAMALVTRVLHDGASRVRIVQT